MRRPFKAPLMYVVPLLGLWLVSPTQARGEELASSPSVGGLLAEEGARSSGSAGGATQESHGVGSHGSSALVHHAVEPIARGFARSLDAETGVEANALVMAPMRFGEAAPWRWATELAATPWEGLGVEAELLMQEDHVHAVRGMVQLRLGHAGRTVHGLQLQEEHHFDRPADVVEVMHVMQAELSPTWQAITLVGGGFSVHAGDGARSGVEAGLEFDAAVSLFHVLDEHIAVGFEVHEHSNQAIPWRVQAMPETHVRFGEHAHWDTGAGLEWISGAMSPLVMTRLVFEQHVRRH